MAKIAALYRRGGERELWSCGGRRQRLFATIGCTAVRSAKFRISTADICSSPIQQKLDRLDEAFLFAQSIDAVSYERQRDRLREELTLAQTLDYKQRLQQLFFPEGIAYDGIRFNRTAVTAPLFNYSAPDQNAEEILVSAEGIEPST